MEISSKLSFITDSQILRKEVFGQGTGSIVPTLQALPVVEKKLRHD